MTDELPTPGFINPVAAMQVLRTEIDGIHRHYDREFASLEHLMDSKLETLHILDLERLRYVNQRFDDARISVEAALIAAKEAVSKAETAAEKRFDSTNEFRGQLSDQAATFMPRAEAEIRMSNLAEQIASNTSNIDRTGGGSSTSQRIVTTILSAAAVMTSIVAVLVVVFHK